MAISSSFVRNHRDTGTATSTEFCTASLSGTYVTGGFTSNPFQIEATAGTSPAVGTTVLETRWSSPTGAQYVSTVVGQVMTTKIFVAGVELANGHAVQDAVLPVVIVKRKI